jgi:hypothetical protein
MFHEWVKRPAGNTPGADLQPSLCVAGDSVFHLDHVGTPIGEHRTCGRSKGELRDFQNSYSRHRLHCLFSPLCS